MKNKFSIKIIVFLLTGILVTTWAGFKQNTAFVYALKAIKKEKKTAGKGWSVSTSGDGKTVVFGSPYFQTQIENKKVVLGFGMLDEKGSDDSLLLADFNAPSGSMLGSSVTISPDGSVVAIGGAGEDNSSKGYFALFVKSSSGWKKPGKDEYFPVLMGFPGLENNWALGMNTGLSKGGQTVVIAAPGDSGFGRVYYFIEPNGGWGKFKDIESLEQGYIGIGGAKNGDEFGVGLGISEDDSTIAVGAPGRNGGKGGLYLFRKPAKGWTAIENLIPIELGELKSGDRFGESVAVSRDGSVVVVGAPGQLGKSTGAVYVITDIDWDKGTYTGYILAPNEEMKNHGISVAISADGKTIAAGTMGVKSMGSVMIYKSKSGKWKDAVHTINIAYTKEEPSTLGAMLGFSVDLTDDGKKVLIGAPLFDNGMGQYIWYDL